MSKAKLTTKIINGAISALKESAPEGAVAYDLVKGISKKGNFSIYSYKDSAGRLIQRESTYENMGKITKKWQAYEYFDNIRRTTTYVSKNNKQYKLVNQNVICFDNAKATKDAWMFDIYGSGFTDTHRISYLAPSKKPQYVDFGTFYTGGRPSINDIVANEGRVLAKRNREYLPLVTSEYMPNVEQKVSHISALQEKKLHLKGVIPPAKQVSQESLQSALGPGFWGGKCSNHTGQVEFYNELYTSRDLLGTLSHEYKHASDFSKINRLKSEIEGFNSVPKEQLDIMSKEIDWFADAMNFAKKSWKKGVIENNSKGGRRFTKLNEIIENQAEIPYLDRLHEIRARQASAEQLQRYDSCWSNLRKLFDAKFIPEHNV